MVVWDHHHRSEHGGGCFLQRRMFVAAGLSAFATYAMVQEAAAAASGFDSRLSATRWIQRQDELARALHAGTVSHVARHDEVDRLAGQVEIDRLLAEIGRGQSTAHTPFMRDPVKRDIRFIDAHGEPRKLTYAAWRGASRRRHDRGADRQFQGGHGALHGARLN
jgi:hypothetical protein